LLSQDWNFEVFLFGYPFIGYKKIIQDKDVNHGLVIGHKDTGAVPWNLFSAGNTDPPEGIEPYIAGGPETGPQMKDKKPFVKPCGTQPDYPTNNKECYGSYQEERPQQK